ncbi:hypothetical protein QAD02_017540, partial [Eretmocerus hayati]
MSLLNGSVTSLGLQAMANLTVGPLLGCEHDASVQLYADDDESIDEVFVQKFVPFMVAIFFGIIFVLGFVGNTLVVVVVMANPTMHSTTNTLIINLAVADLLFVIFCVPFTATDYVLPYWPFGNLWCKVVQYLIIVTACCSVYTLVLMSLDRYLAVVHPIASMSVRTSKHASIAIGVVWLIILTFSLPALIVHGEYTDTLITNVSQPCSVLATSGAITSSSLHDGYVQIEEVHTACRILPEANRTLFQLPFFLGSYVVPLTLICSLYICMLMRLWRVPRVGADGHSGRKRVTRLVIVVVGVFAFSWFPIQVILVLKALDWYPNSTLTIILQIASHVLAYANSCVNPILYAFLSENFRKAFRKIIYCGPTAGQEHQPTRPTTSSRISRPGNSIDIL